MLRRDKTKMIWKKSFWKKVLSTNKLKESTWVTEFLNQKSGQNLVLSTDFLHQRDQGDPGEPDFALGFHDKLDVGTTEEDLIIDRVSIPFIQGTEFLDELLTSLLEVFGRNEASFDEDDDESK